ncbi:hypothetical protein ORI20_25950 [Mycobacterium sp. CVI_P3]|uniref:Ryanodine receptor Ryr domain-containing protein n=1 Tax=Mycobacterium pinniadriaticum TaxID=2994102 RepID=A0ABT3SKU6_9MYCO|nr:hypothetical protein [Mycobacterium pinniadriaticum]MCX2933720.1 hypothetical protein [Mycobacterium pinniadriaticum]MCX2940142.1 hypothetical protein [Mycobacterium pinniadriaticum]
MPRPSASRIGTLRAVLGAVAALAVGYLGVLAAWPQVRDGLPPALAWFGRPNSAVTIAVVSVLLVLLAAVLARSGTESRAGAPIAVVAGLALLSAVLGVASYWRCQDDSHPDFFTPLIWTAELVKGGNPVRALDSGACPSPTPVALNIAQLSALAAVFLSVIGVAVALFQSRLDRLRARLAGSVTAVVDLDDDGSSMLAAIARNLDRRSTLVVVTSDPDRPCVRAARVKGACVLAVDFGRPATLASLPIWDKLDRLYLMSPDPSTNLARLQTITERVTRLDDRQRLPLIVRIDDPWQADAWRAQHFGGSDTIWAADTVGKYEVTARRLLDMILAGTPVDRIMICGTSQLTLALCADMTQRRIENDYHSDDAAALPELTLVGPAAEEYLADHDHSVRRIGLSPDFTKIRAVNDNPTVPVLSSLLAAGPATAVILVDGAPGIDTSTGTRLAARFPDTPIYAWDADADTSERRATLVGQLRTYRLSLDLPGGQAQDAWERAARLIHQRYAAEVPVRTPASLPWDELDEFYRGSNRRQVRNALWMVEKIGGHTWNTWGQSPDRLSTAELRRLPPLEQLQRMGFERDTAIAMARAEHEDWCRYYRAAGWQYGPTRDDARKIHDKLTDFAAIEADPALLNSALSSLAATLTKLRELGYRSRPIADSTESPWNRFRRTGLVIAERRDKPWTWTTTSGERLQADAGDWAVSEPDGQRWWSVKDPVFRAQHSHLDGSRWRRDGVVSARPARAGEVIETLEGRTTAGAGDWVVQGEHGEQWPVPADEFARRYEGPV